MPRSFQVTGLVIICFVAGSCFAQSKQSRSLCGLQDKVAEGDHMNVRVAGTYSVGPEGAVLIDARCPAQSIWIEFALQTKQNDSKLRELTDRSNKAVVVFEGEFYGPPVPDAKLPDAIRKNYHPGWGHLGAFKTKLVVHAIREVAVASPPKP
jgi:hypothetical protein